MRARAHTHIYKIKERRIKITILKEFLEKKLKNLDLA
jgi:hypothetical protein